MGCLSCYKPMKPTKHINVIVQAADLNELPSVHLTHPLSVTWCAHAMAFQFGQHQTFDPPTVRLPCSGTNKAYLLSTIMPHNHSFLRHLELIYIDCAFRNDLANSFAMFFYFPNISSNTKPLSKCFAQDSFQEAIHILSSCC